MGVSDLSEGRRLVGGWCCFLLIDHVAKEVGEGLVFFPGFGEDEVTVFVYSGRVGVAVVERGGNKRSVPVLLSRTERGEEEEDRYQ